MRADRTRRLVLMALLVALGTAVSQLNFPVAGARAYPIQATVDVLASSSHTPGPCPSSLTAPMGTLSSPVWSCWSNATVTVAPSGAAAASPLIT